MEDGNDSSSSSNSNLPTSDGGVVAVGEEENNEKEQNLDVEMSALTMTPTTTTMTTTTSSVRDRKQQNRIEMTRFWSILRTKIWMLETKLDQIQVVSPGSDDEDRKPSPEQQLNDLKSQFIHLRKEALAVASGERWWYNDDDDHTNHDGIDNKQKSLPDDGTTDQNHPDTYDDTYNHDHDDNKNNFQLTSTTDWRLLHDELSKFSTKLEWKRQETITSHKRAFRFHRYRTELAKRRQKTTMMGKEDYASTRTSDGINSSLRQQSIQDAQQSNPPIEVPPPKSCLKDLSNSRIIIVENGKVSLNEIIDVDKKDRSTSENEHNNNKPFNVLPSGTPLHLWNLSNCSITIDQKQLPAVYLVGIHNCTVILKSKIVSSIHMTDCHTSSLQLSQIAQQMRIHQCDQLSIHLSRPWPSGSIIMEHSQQLEFNVVVGSPNDEISSSNSNKVPVLDVKDFNWLRAGIPSPNFTIKTVHHRGSDHHDDEINMVDTNSTANQQNSCKENKDDNDKESNEVPSPTTTNESSDVGRVTEDRVTTPTEDSNEDDDDDDEDNEDSDDEL